MISHYPSSKLPTSSNSLWFREFEKTVISLSIKRHCCEHQAENFAHLKQSSKRSFVLYHSEIVVRYHEENLFFLCTK